MDADPPDAPVAGPPALAFVMDYSGSMVVEVEGGGTRVEAMVALVRQISAGLPDRVLCFTRFNSGVISAECVEDPSPEEIGARLPLQVGGGTEYYPAIDQTADLLRQRARPRHMVFLTDGRPGSSDFALEAAEEARSLWGIEILTVGMGRPDRLAQFRDLLLQMTGAEPGEMGPWARHFELSARGDVDAIAQAILEAVR